MLSVRSLRAKILLSALIPIVVTLVAVAAIASFVYERDARQVVEQRDTELAEITAARLFEGLSLNRLVLENLAAESGVQLMRPLGLKAALDRAQSQLFAFDAGVVVYDGEGVAVWSDAFSFRRRGEDFPVPSEFGSVRSTLEPRFSDVFSDPYSGDKAIMLTVPIVASGGEFRGALAGIYTLGSLAANATFATVLEIAPGKEGFAYLVDGNGRVIFHRDGSRLGTDLSDIEAVARAKGGETGAVVAEGPEDKAVISGFAPLPDVSWSVVTQQRWNNVTAPIRRNSMVLLGLLIIGGVASGGLIFFGIGRILKPIKDLTDGAQRIAGGDFAHIISAETGDEIQSLAQQFNTMAGALKESYADLEERVAARTKELGESEQRLRTVVTGAPVVLFALDREGTFVLSEGKGLDALGLGPGEAVGRSAFDMYRDVPQLLDNIRCALAGEEVTSVVELGGSTFESRYSPLRGDDGEVVGLIGVATDISERRRAEESLIQQARELAVLDERNRMAREIHDTLAQGFTGIVLQLEAAEQATEESPAEVPEHLSRAKTLARESLQEARRSVWALLPGALEKRSLDTAL